MANRRIWQRVLLALLLAASIFVGWHYPPPPTLVDWAGGQELWVRILLALFTYLAFLAVFAPFGAFDALEVTLPFGLGGVKRGGQEAAPADDRTQRALEELHAVLRDLRDANDRAFSNLDDLSRQLQETLEKIDELERRTGALEAQVSRTASGPHREVGQDDQSAR